MPTTVELGFPDLVMPQWYGLLAPAGLPATCAHTLEQQIACGAALAGSGGAACRLRRRRAEGRAELQAILDADFKKWPVLLPKLGIKAE